VAWLSTPPTSLADVARREQIRRQLAPAAARVYTNQDLPAAPEVPPPAAAPPATAEPPSPETSGSKPAETAKPAAPAPESKPDSKDVKHDEAWWRDRITKAREALAHDQLMAEALQSRINGLTSDWINRDDPAQKAQLFEQRQQALAELDRTKKKIDDDGK